jgi:hypothetical protein
MECVKAKCVPKEIECDPKCQEGFVCKQGKCVASGNITAFILKREQAGDKTKITLNKGSNQGIAKGMKGSVNGVKNGSFTIIEVFPVRSVGLCSAPYGETVNAKSATIKLE